ncbi:MAG TPA: hypothetical protein H9734_03170 [Candidatus Fusicatenibacter merdavium]|uniref:Uncharacterized protein n=1 Tax=Candidatus Fusicatenibacter merdavium TaxID=2838600 RepID=A0A9D2BHB1_9FIRM|nr:hypothetical protein [Candidatus Fusicatenibacter merdavium]
MNKRRTPREIVSAVSVFAELPGADAVNAAETARIPGRFSVLSPHGGIGILNPMMLRIAPHFILPQSEKHSKSARSGYFLMFLRPPKGMLFHASMKSMPF